MARGAKNVDLINWHIQQLRLRLLDLSCRNRLLSFKHSDKARTHIRVVDELPQFLFDALMSGQSLEFRAVPRPRPPAGTGEHTARVEDVARAQGVNPEVELPEPRGTAERAEHEDRFIQTLHFPEDMANKLDGIRQSSRTALEELGIPTLYAAFGFLEWYESDSSEQAHMAPLVLLPLRLERVLQRTTWRYRVQCTSEEAETNITLEERLQRDFRLVLPEFGSKSTLESHLKRVGKAIQDQARWRVRRFVTVGSFQFARLVMYRDLDPERWTGAPPSEHPVLARLLTGQGARPSGGEELEDLDAPEAEGRRPLVVLNADASQEQAMMDALEGRNLVIEGPPGTGKSQTIANLIAAALHLGKRVLFVADKAAALDVVRKRLHEADLGPFCFDLHDPERSKAEVIRELAERLDLRPGGFSAQEYEAHCVELRRRRRALVDYATLLKSRAGDTDESVRDFLCGAARAAEGVRELPVKLQTAELPDATQLTSRALEEARVRLSAFQDRAADVGSDGSSVQANAWSLATRAGLSPLDRPRLRAAVSAWHERVRALAATVEEGGADVGATGEDDVRRWSALAGSLPDPDTVDLSLFWRLREPESAVGLARALRGMDRRAEIIGDLAGVCAAPELVVGQRNKLDRAVAAFRSASVGEKRLSELPAWVAANARRADALSEAAQSIRLVLELCGLPVNRAERSLPWLLRAADLLRQAEPAVLAARPAEMASETQAAALTTWSRQAQELRAEWVEAHQRFPGMAELQLPVLLSDATPPILRAHANVLQSTEGVFAGLLSTDFREAKRIFCRFTRGRPAPRGEMAQALQYLAGLIERRHTFESDARARHAVGARFAGIDTDFEPLVRAASWIASVKSSTAALKAAPRALRDFLLNAPVDHLLAFQQTLEPSEAVLTEWLAPGHPGTLADTARELARASEEVADALAGIEIIGIATEQRASVVERITRRAAELQILDEELAALADTEGLLPENRLPERSARAAIDAAALIFEARLPEAALAAAFSQEPDSGLSWLLAWLHRVVEQARLETEARTDCERVGIAASETAARASSLAGIVGRLERCLAAESELPAWLAFMDARERACASLAAPILRAWETTSAPVSVLLDVFEHARYRLLARKVSSAHEDLMSWDGTTLESARNAFCKLDEELLQLNRRLLVDQLCGVEIPRGTSSGKKAVWSESSLIRHEDSKKRRQRPIRDLVRRAHGAILKSKPCFLMSPLSVSRYLPVGPPDFDLVIIDEASQMRPEEACAAILRGKQLVVVGDENQLPPTRFFEKSESSNDSEDEDEAGDEPIAAESILGLAKGAFGATRTLKWHYRSRHESLIAFSNEHFYGGRLRVFPSAVQTGKFGVRLERVAGAYANGENPLEAQAVAEAALEFMYQHPDESLGVVAMNIKQTGLIDSLISEMVPQRGDNGYAERWGSTLEKFFVKNLESVQGDERDVIFISMTYGPQQAGSGKMAQHFGPINSVEGHRRLNVLFTRAKRRVVVFSSMTPDHVVLGPGSKRGVRELRNYLEYAASGGVGLGHETDRGYDSPFEEEVAELLRREGHAVTPQVGVNGFFIDLGVKHPTVPGRYLCGVECDGALYHSSRSARERDRLREHLLKELGWHLVRVWSTDWYRDRKNTSRRLLDQVKEQLTKE